MKSTNNESSQDTNFYTLKRSSRADKKFMLINSNGKKVHFGASGMDDYTITNNDD